MDEISPKPNRTNINAAPINSRQLAAKVASAGAQQEEPEQDFRHYVRIVWHRKWMILFLLLVFALLGALQLRRSPVLYTALAEIKYEPRASAVLELGEISQTIYQRDEIATAVYMIRSPAVALAVLENVGRPTVQVEAVDESPMARISRFGTSLVRTVRNSIITTSDQAVDPALLQEEGRIRGMLNGLRVNQKPETKIIEVRYTHRDRQFATRVANEFCRQFINSIDTQFNERRLEARQALNQQLIETEQRLRDSEGKLFELSQETDQFQVMDQNLNTAIATITQIIQDTERRRTEIALLEAKERALVDEAYRWKLVREDPKFSQLLNRLDELKIQRAQMAAVFEPSYPQLIAIEREITIIDEQMKTAEADAINSVKAELLISRESLKGLIERSEEQRTRVRDLEEKMIPYRIAMRQVESNRVIYADLLNRFKQLEATEDVRPATVTIVTSASVPTVPSSPNFTRTMSMFLMLGFGLGVGVAFLLHYADRSVKNPDLIEEKYQVSTLAFVPFIEGGGGGFFSRKKVASPLLDPNSKAMEAEAFHYLRTSIQYSSAQHAPQVILVTSCFPQEGKSTISSNLAIFCSGRGGKTLLIDADLKRPRMHKLFGFSKAPGLSDVLTGQVELRDAIKQVPGNPNLDMLTAGLSSPSPLNLLESDAMTQLLDRLRQEYTTIILDSAPCHGMADSLVLASRVDGVCLVVKLGSTLTDVLEKTLDKLSYVGANVLGIIYNSTQLRRESGYGYSYTYTYRYDSRPDKDDEQESPKKEKEAVKVV